MPVTSTARINRICVIGAHGVGKSTLVKALKDVAALKKFQVTDEVARQASDQRSKISVQKAVATHIMLCVMAFLR